MLYNSIAHNSIALLLLLLTCGSPLVWQCPPLSFALVVLSLTDLRFEPLRLAFKHGGGPVVTLPHLRFPPEGNFVYFLQLVLLYFNCHSVIS